MTATISVRSMMRCRLMYRVLFIIVVQRMKTWLMSILSSWSVTENMGLLVPAQRTQHVKTLLMMSEKEMECSLWQPYTKGSTDTLLQTVLYLISCGRFLGVGVCILMQSSWHLFAVESGGGSVNSESSGWCSLFWISDFEFSSVPWHWWLGDRKGIWPVKTSFQLTFVRSFIIAGRVRPTLDPSAETVSRSSALAQGERRGIGWCVRVCAWRAGKEG